MYKETDCFALQALDKKPTAIQFKRPNHHCTEKMKEILWKLATKQLKQTEWKKMAHHWKFTENHIKAI